MSFFFVFPGFGAAGLDVVAGDHFAVAHAGPTIG